MSANPQMTKMTIAEYLEYERNSDIKHEYLQSEVYAMAGASPNHNRLTFRLGSRIDNHIEGKGCEGFSGDQLVYIEKADTYFYPDISVTCNKPEFTDDNPQALKNPQVIIEVLSPSTQEFDKDEKFTIYRKIQSFREYVLVWQDKARIVSYYLNDDGQWEFNDVTGLDSSITLKSIDCTLPLADIYQNVTFEESGD